MHHLCYYLIVFGNLLVIYTSGPTSPAFSVLYLSTLTSCLRPPAPRGRRTRGVRTPCWCHCRVCARVCLCHPLLSFYARGHAPLPQMPTSRCPAAPATYPCARSFNSNNTRDGRRDSSNSSGSGCVCPWLWWWLWRVGVGLRLTGRSRTTSTRCYFSPACSGLECHQLLQWEPVGRQAAAVPHRTETVTAGSRRRGRLEAAAAAAGPAARPERNS